MMWSFASLSKHFFRVVVITKCNGGFLGQLESVADLKHDETTSYSSMVSKRTCAVGACGTVSLLWLLQTSARVKIASYCRGVLIYCKSGEVKSNFFKVYLTTRVDQSPVQLKRITHSRGT